MNRAARFMKSRRNAIGAATLVGSLVGACSGADPRPTTSSAAPHSAATPLHLLDQLADATVHGSLRGLDGVADESSAVLLAEEFDAPLAFPWFDDAWLDESLLDDHRPRRAAVRLVATESGRLGAIDAASHGLHALVATEPDAAYLVSARLRAPAGSRGAAVRMTPLSIAAPDAAGLRAALLAVPDAERLGGRASALPDDAIGGWRDLSLFLAPRAGARTISISLLPSDQGLEIDRVELRRLATPARIHHTPRLACDGSLDPRRRVVDLVDEVCDALLVPAAAAITFHVAVPATRPRLRFLPGALCDSRGRAVDLVVRAEGRELWRRRMATFRIDEATALVPVEIDLVPLAGQRIAIEFAAETADDTDAVGWFGAPELLGSAPPDRPRRKNLLLISLDTTRSDLLGCYGNKQGLTPHLDAFATQATRFDQVVSPSAWTLPTHMSLFTGQHPILHGMIAHPRYMDPVRSRPLAARLREQGWCTAAFTGGGPMVPRNGFGYGFDYYGTNNPLGLTKYNHEAPDQRAVRASNADWLAPTLEWMRAHHEQLFFLFVHTFFVHNYFPHPEYLAKFADPAARIERDQPLVMGEKAMAGDAAALERLKRLYAAALHETDATLIPRLLGELDALNLADDTIVCILADHGEEHLDHGQFGHRLELWRESTRVPWLLRGPGVPAGAVRRDKVDLADVSATLASLLELPPEPLDFGRDQLAPGAGETDDEHEFLLLFGPFREPGGREALEVGPWKLMRWRKEGGATELKLFNLDEDPLERNDRAAEDPVRLRTLTLRLDRRLRALEEQAAELPGSNVLTRDLTQGELERLKGLGYGDG